jgi:hypothetical protein
MKRKAIRNYRTILVVANALVAFLSLTNLFFIAAGAIVVDVPDAEDLLYEYDPVNQTLMVNTSFTVKNSGIYSVKHLDIASTLCTDTGYCLVEYNENDLRVPPGEERTFPVSVILDLDRLADPEMLRFLVDEGEFELKVKVKAEYTMGLTEFRSEESIWYPWIPPLDQLRDLILEGNLSLAIEEALGWAGPAVREWLSPAILDAAMSEGEWRHKEMSEWAAMDYRLLLNETTGNGTFDVLLAADLGGFLWHVNGTVPLRIIDGQVYLEEEVISDVA